MPSTVPVEAAAEAWWAQVLASLRSVMGDTVTAPAPPAPYRTIVESNKGGHVVILVENTETHALGTWAVNGGSRLHELHLYCHRVPHFRKLALDDFLKRSASGSNHE
jgi:hypothetical protein